MAAESRKTAVTAAKSRKTAVTLLHEGEVYPIGTAESSIPNSQDITAEVWGEGDED